jgi:predicted acylesterase/phospholipase RssA
MSVPYRVLACGGGGVRGFLQVGALLELERRCAQPLVAQFQGGVYGSSIGAILATAVAFGLRASQIRSIAKSCLRMQRILPPASLGTLSALVQHKGCTTMDTFATIVCEGFAQEGLDLRTKRCSDAQIPLRIVASNLTRGLPSVLQGQVPVLRALQASCCIPILFQPISIRGQLYIDGDILCPDIVRCVPLSQRAQTLVCSLRQPYQGLTPERLEQMQIWAYLHRVYKSIHSMHRIPHPATISLTYPNVYALTELQPDEEDDMIYAGQSLTRDFFSH